MKIVFLCGSAEPGKDGIGDYTSRLANALHLLGHSVSIIAFNDKFVDKYTESNKELPTFRIPEKYALAQKGQQIAECLVKLNPDWISLQFVSYAFEKHGIPYNINEFVKALNGFPLQVMFHELWIGEEAGATLKRKMVGILQRKYILQFMKKLQPSVIHTSIGVYQKILEHYSIKAELLPLFSNIPFALPIDSNRKVKLLEIAGLNSEAKVLCGVIFGSIYYQSWNLESLFRKLEELQQSGQQILVVSIGKIEEGKEFWDQLRLRYPTISFLTLGPQDAVEISYWLSAMDFGIATTPYLLLGKSGSYMAMKEHGLPVFCDKNKIKFNFGVNDADMAEAGVITIGEEKIDIVSLIHQKPRISTLSDSTQKFLLDLQKVDLKIKI